MKARSLVWFSPLLLAMGAHAQDPGPYRGVIENDPLLRSIFSPRVVTTETLNATPSTYRDVPVRMVLAFESRGRIQNPFFTRFTNETYLNFSAWDAEMPLWEADAFVAPHALFFAERGSRPARVFSTAKRFERFEVRVMVKDTFGGRAWVEVLEAKPLEKALSGAAIRHVHNGLAQMREGRSSVAAGELQQALKANLPESHRARVLFFTARAFEQMGRNDLASTYLAEAHQLRPDDSEIRHAYGLNLAWMQRRAQGGSPAVAKQEIPKPPQATAQGETVKDPAQPVAAQQAEEETTGVVREGQPIQIESKKELQQQSTTGTSQGEESEQQKNQVPPETAGGKGTRS